MTRIARTFTFAGAVAMLGAGLAISPLASATSFAQAQPSTQMPAKSSASHSSKKMASSEMKSTKKAAGSRRDVEIVQAALTNAGYPVEIDGHMNKATEDALKKYQADHKLKVTGTIDNATVKSLNITSLKSWS